VLYRLAARDHFGLARAKVTAAILVGGRRPIAASQASLRNPRRSPSVDVSISRPTLSPWLSSLRIPPRGTGVGDIVGLPVRDAGTSVICRMQETLMLRYRETTGRCFKRPSLKRRKRELPREGSVDSREISREPRVELEYLQPLEIYSYTAVNKTKDHFRVVVECARFETDRRESSTRVR